MKEEASVGDNKEDKNKPFFKSYKEKKKYGKLKQSLEKDSIELKSQLDENLSKKNLQYNVSSVVGISTRIKVLTQDPVKIGTCIFSGDSANSEVSRLSIDMDPSITQESPLEKKKNNDTVYLRIDAVREMVDELERLIEKGESQVYRANGYDLSINNRKVSPTPRNCAVCGNEMIEGKELQIGYKYSIHFKCIPRFKNAIENIVDNHLGGLVASEI